MDTQTESIIGSLESRGIPVDRDLLRKRIARLKCQTPVPDILACNGEMIVLRIFDVLQHVVVASGAIVATMPVVEPQELDKSADLQVPSQEQTKGTERMGQDQTDEQKADSAFQKAIEEAVKKITASNPDELRSPRFERQGSSWSLTL